MGCFAEKSCPLHLETWLISSFRAVESISGYFLYNIKFLLKIVTCFVYPNSSCFSYSYRCNSENFLIIRNVTNYHTITRKTRDNEYLHECIRKDKRHWPPSLFPGVLSFFFFSGRILLPGNTFRSETLNYYWMPIIVSYKLSFRYVRLIEVLF